MHEFETAMVNEPLALEPLKFYCISSYCITRVRVGISLYMSSYEHIVCVGLVGCFGFSGPLSQYFSLYRAVSQREGERGERIEESKNVQTTPTRT